MDPNSRHQDHESGGLAARPDVVTVATIEDDRDVREGIAALVDATEGFRCVGRYRTMEEALSGLGRVRPNVALVDIGLPGMSGIEGITLLRERHPATLVVMLTVYADNDRIFDAICAGACGYLLKKTPPEKLIEGLREVVQGGAPMSPDVASRVLKIFRDVRPPKSSSEDLTPHEVRLLKLMVEGHTYRSAGAILRVTPHAVSFHLRRIYGKLQVHTKSEAVGKAIKQRLI